MHVCLWCASCHFVCCQMGALRKASSWRFPSLPCSSPICVKATPYMPPLDPDLFHVLFLMSSLRAMPGSNLGSGVGSSLICMMLFPGFLFALLLPLPSAVFHSGLVSSSLIVWVHISYLLLALFLLFFALILSSLSFSLLSSMLFRRSSMSSLISTILVTSCSIFVCSLHFLACS